MYRKERRTWDHVGAALALGVVVTLVALGPGTSTPSTLGTPSTAAKAASAIASPVMNTPSTLTGAHLASLSGGHHHDDGGGDF